MRIAGLEGGHLEANLLRTQFLIPLRNDRPQFRLQRQPGHTTMQSTVAYGPPPLLACAAVHPVPLPMRPGLGFGSSTYGSRNIFRGGFIGIQIHRTKGWGRTIFLSHYDRARTGSPGAFDLVGLAEILCVPYFVRLPSVTWPRALRRRRDSRGVRVGPLSLSGVDDPD